MAMAVPKAVIICISSKCKTRKLHSSDLREKRRGCSGRQTIKGLEGAGSRDLVVWPDCCWLIQSLQLDKCM